MRAVRSGSDYFWQKCSTAQLSSLVDCGDIRQFTAPGGPREVSIAPRVSCCAVAMPACMFGRNATATGIVIGTYSGSK